MADESHHLSLEEVGRLLSRQRQADLLRLAALAETWVRGIPRRDAADLLNEALARVLSGKRPWPADVSLHAFLSQVMRSIASQWRHEDAREPLAADHIADLNEVAADETGNDLADLTQRMREALLSDGPALGIFDHILTQTSRKQACEQLGLDATAYDTARRRMTRTLRRQFKPGWINDDVTRLSR
jgi:DNA-directed RNA polymerase specialized sigma24 family protein